MRQALFSCLSLLFCLTVSAQQPARTDQPLHLAFSAVGDAEGRTERLVVPLPADQEAPVHVLIKGEDADQFYLAEESRTADGLALTFGYRGAGVPGRQQAEATLHEATGRPLATIQLRGLTSRALEGANEPPLSEVVRTLGYQVDIGWEDLANHLRPEAQGEEVEAPRFRRAGSGPVIMEPVARYSPDFALPFGYYRLDDSRPRFTEVGVLAQAEEIPEHQTLHPQLLEGATSFDPGDEPFGLYTTSPTHTAYTEDRLNAAYHPDHAEHAVRTFPLRDSEGEIIPNAYLVCFEEASNGDYQDYVFVLRNVAVADAP